MSTTTRPARRPTTTAESARTFLELSHLLDEVERSHPEISGPLRLTLVRAHRDHQVGWLDQARFREVVAELLGPGDGRRRGSLRSSPC